MWVFTKWGFVSVVCARDKKGKVDSEKVVVRSRNKRHLESIKRMYGYDEKIMEDAGTDYAYRMVVRKSDWAKSMADLTEAIDYANFKTAAEDNSGVTGQDYVDALHKIWFMMLQLQRGANGKFRSRFEG